MKKFLPGLICLAGTACLYCCSSEYDIFENDVEQISDQFSVAEARAYFERTAEDLRGVTIGAGGFAVLDAGGVPQLRELLLHNGTIYRWNRPIYDTHGGRPHLRVENRILPAGPTICDTVANMAFYYGALHKFATEDRPVWTQMSFSAAETNVRHGARDGMFARLYWPGFNALSPDELVLRHLLPAANEGLEALGVSSSVSDHYLGIIEARCLNRQNGAMWQIEAVRHFEDEGMDRSGALTAMLAAYIERMHTNDPVHTWTLPGA